MHQNQDSRNERKRNGDFVPFTCKIPRVLIKPPTFHSPSPVNSSRLAAWLDGYDTGETNWMVEGFTVGFRLGCLGMAGPRSCNNQASANNRPDVVENYIEKETGLGRLAGPFDESPFDDLVCAPMGIRDKSSGGYRAIANLSFPYGDSVNSHIPVHAKTVKYPRVDDAMKFMVKEGVGCYAAKTDIKEAFRVVPVHPDDYHLLGIKWNDQYSTMTKY